MTDHQLSSRGSAAPSPLSKPAVAGVGAARSALGGFGGAAAEVGGLAGIAKQAKNPVSHVAPALAAAARGETVAQQAARMTGKVKMTAADALRVAGALDPSPAVGKQKSGPAGKTTDQPGFQSPFITVALSGITEDQDGAEDISRVINGANDPHAYAVYGANDKSYAGKGVTGVNSPDAKKGPVSDELSDIAAVTQYAAAAELGIKLTPNAKGDGRQVQINWGALENMNVQADQSVFGKVQYDNPAKVAENGYQAVLADMAKRDIKPGEGKDQFIGLTGHSGGGQSSFYTALKLASEGYKNVSVVGVDMAMTPHQREVLESLGVNVTNITSNATNADGSKTNSLIGDGIRAGMGGGANYYDLNVNRQSSSTDPKDMHGVINDANVVTTVRFAQYLDSVGAHGDFSPEQYANFMKASGQTGDKFSGVDKDGNRLPVQAANKDIFQAGSSTVTDQRKLPGADDKSTKFGGGSSWVENTLNLLGGQPVTQAIQGAGNWLHNGFDKAGEYAKSAAGLIPQAGGFLGGLFNKGANLLGKGVNAAGNLLGNGLNAAGNLADSAMSGVANVSNFIGGAASSGLHAAGDGVSAVGNTIGNGLDKAGDVAQSWLGGIPWVGGFLGNAANKGLDLLGGGVSAVGNAVGNGIGAVGDAAQWAGGKVASGASAIGNLAHQGLDAAGNGARWLGGALSNGLGMLGGWGQKAITGASSAVGNFVGNTASAALGAVGTGVDTVFDWAGQGAGALIRSKTAPLIWGLQASGVDTSQVDGLSDFQGTNPSERWRRQMAADEAAGKSSRIQTIPVVDEQRAAADPVHAHYAN